MKQIIFSIFLFFTSILHAGVVCEITLFGSEGEVKASSKVEFQTKLYREISYSENFGEFELNSVLKIMGGNQFVFSGTLSSEELDFTEVFSLSAPISQNYEVLIDIHEQSSTDGGKVFCAGNL